jgi:transposase
MGRLSAYAKNRILKLRFKKNKRIIHIVEILKRDDNIKVSRQAVSTFLKKYLETNSIYDKPRTGRKRKLTQEEIQLIGQVTRLNRDITARAIKEYLNLNVSTYTILRATKLFEWNKINPNSNDSKKAAALERQLNGESDVERRRSTSANSVKKSSKSSKKSSKTDEAKMNDDDVGGIEEIENVNEKKVVRIHTQQVDELNQESFGANHDESYEDANNTDEMTNQLDEIERIQNKLLTTSENSMVVLDQVGSKDSEISLRKSDSSKKLHKYYTSVPGKIN